MKNIYDTIMQDAADAPYFPQLLFRDVLLPELLGDDKGAIGYWAGKALARKFPLANPKDAAVFFHQAGLGTLTLVKQSAQVTRWQLSGEPVALRKRLATTADFTLEAGFLAEMMAQQLGIAAEAELVETPRKLRNQAITLDVYTDPADTIGADYDAPEPLTIQDPLATSDQEPVDH